MKNEIRIWGIETNNLHGIDVTLKKKAINLIIGPSGSGKSSLAYDTVAGVGQHEFMSMFADNIAEPAYRIRGYENMAAAVPIRQTNFNNNLRSTIGTYFGISREIALLYSLILDVDQDVFVLNKPENICEKCHGLGFTKELDENRIVNNTTKLKDNPFRCWNRYKDFYAQIITAFCIDNGIDPKKRFRDLSYKEQKLILYSSSEKKYSIRYKKTNMFSRRTTRYYGVMTGTPMMINYNISDKFFSERECSLCHGRRFAQDHDQYKILGLSIGAFLTTPFSELEDYIRQLKKKYYDSKLEFSIDSILNFISKANDLNLGHLFFNRSIPTLSGGELQRLRMVQVFNTQLSDLLVVLDEPLAGLSGTEKDTVYNNVISLAKSNTVIVVDHGERFVKDAEVILALGPGGGVKGGLLIDPYAFLEEQRKLQPFDVAKSNESIRVAVKFNIYNYSGVQISLMKDALNLIYGASGIGKSTLLREYLPQFFESYTYISQKPITGNRNSCVATVTGISMSIADIFAKKFHKDRHYFSNQTGDAGACPVCDGAGFLEYGTDQENMVRIKCRDCEGSGFNKILKKNKIKEKSIFEIWNMTVDEMADYVKEIDSGIYQSLKVASSIMLGHLRIGQPTSTLSGGENIRIKLLKAGRSTSTVLGIDEPFRGLSSTEIYAVAVFLETLREKGKTIAVVDHTEEAERYFANKIHLINKKGVLSSIDNE